MDLTFQWTKLVRLKERNISALKRTNLITSLDKSEQSFGAVGGAGMSFNILSFEPS